MMRGRITSDRARVALPAVYDRSAMSTGALAVVEAWLHAVNRGDTARLQRLTHDEVEIVGPRGAGRADRAVLADWLARAGFSAESLRWFCGAGGTVVVEQHARWIDPLTGADRGQARVASRFRVDGERVARYVRHDDGLGAALAAAGLTEGDEVTVRSRAERPG
jgi:hypothetical protein